MKSVSRGKRNQDLKYDVIFKNYMHTFEFDANKSRNGAWSVNVKRE